MAGLTDYSARAELDIITGKSPSAARYIAAFTAVGTDAGSGFTEASYTGYARVTTAAANWNSATGSAPSTASNAADFNFPVCTASPGNPILAWGIYDDPSAGNLLFWDYMYAVSGASAAAQAWRPFTCSSVGSGSGTVLDVPAHSFSNGDTLVVDTEYGGTPPTFTQSNFTGTLVVANATTDTFTVTNGGTAVWTSSTGSGVLRKVVPQSMVANLQPQIPAGAMVLSLA